MLLCSASVSGKLGARLVRRHAQIGKNAHYLQCAALCTKSCAVSPPASFCVVRWARPLGTIPGPGQRLVGLPFGFPGWHDLAYDPILWFCHAARPGLISAQQRCCPHASRRPASSTPGAEIAGPPFVPGRSLTGGGGLFPILFVVKDAAKTRIEIVPVRFRARRNHGEDVGQCPGPSERRYRTNLSHQVG